jgi:hypothetical protein
MRSAVNPFLQVDVTEGIQPERFVRIFSPLLVADTEALFRPGNVVLMGIQGTGKTALLNLLKPEVQIAYFQTEDGANPFPVPMDCRRFISGGINLIRSGAIDFGQRAIPSDTSKNLERIPSYFADFLNYWIVRDLIGSFRQISRFQQHERHIGAQLNAEPAALDRFALAFGSHDCWRGYLASATDIESLLQLMDRRIGAYRDFLNFNTDDIPEEVRTTKTGIGDPISVLAALMSELELVPNDFSFFVRIDQYEELSRLEDWSGSEGLLENYRAVIHKMIGARDPRVSYRIGTRRHAWDAAPRMFGTTNVIEELRNYRLIDIDDILRRREHRPSVFPTFAEDVFNRRLFDAGLLASHKRRGSLTAVFGGAIKPAELARIYCRIKTDHHMKFSELPSDLAGFLVELSTADPLSASLGYAWIRQRMKRSASALELTAIRALPWEQAASKWWKKERIAQATMQLAAENQQRMVWAGKADLMNLSGGNILVFVTLCQFVWSAWLRSLEKTDGVEMGKGLPKISDPYIQDEGIQQASSYWLRKLREDPTGDSRQRFIAQLARYLRDGMLRDKDMSYPGANGITLTKNDLAENLPVQEFLFSASAFGALYDRRHTPKSRSRGESTKWYLNPVLSPNFQLPVSHTKEPKYVRIDVVLRLISDAQVQLAKREKKNGVD